MPSRTSLYKPHGFTVLETLVAAMLFATVTVSLSLLFSGAQKGTLKSLHQMSGNSLASSRIAQVKQDAKNGVQPIASTGVYNLATIRRGVESNLEMTYEVIVVPHLVGVFDVTVVVTWTYQDQDYRISREILVSPRA